MDKESRNNLPNDEYEFNYGIDENDAEKDDFVIGEGFSFNELEEIKVNTKHKKNVKKKQQKGCLKGAVWLVVIIAVALIIGGTIITFLWDFLGLSNPSSVEIEIEKGTSVSEIADTLKENDILKMPFVFRIYSKIKGYDSQYKYGLYVFSADDGYEGIAKKLISEGAQANSVKVLIPEGSTVDDIAAILEKNGICHKKDFYNVVRNGEFDFDFVSKIPTSEVYYRLEGYLAPDTYYFYNTNNESGARLAVLKMLNNFEQKLTAEIKTAVENSDYSLHGILSLASIIELEASSASFTEKQNVSAVFHNRLNWTDQPKLLGSTPTADYPYGQGRYNTNKVEGLPPGPLCQPSLDSIKAALNPTPDFIANYFVTDKDMNFYYNETLKQHNSTIARLKSQGKWA